MIALTPIGVVRTSRVGTQDDNWGDVESTIELRADLPGESLEGLEALLHVDAADGSPELDIKPVMAECLPRDPVRQPSWSHDLMRGYWRE